MSRMSSQQNWQNLTIEKSFLFLKCCLAMTLPRSTKICHCLGDVTLVQTSAKHQSKQLHHGGFQQQHLTFKPTQRHCYKRILLHWFCQEIWWEPPPPQRGYYTDLSHLDCGGWREMLVIFIFLILLHNMLEKIFTFSAWPAHRSRYQ